jgi:hypothetical protein
MNALPGDYDFVENWFRSHDRKSRASWERVLDRHKVFGEGAYSKYGTAVAGFVLDVLTDPTTYTGLGIAKAARSIQGAGGTVKLLTEAEKLRGVGRAASVFGEKLIPRFRLKQFAQTSDEAQEAIEAFFTRQAESGAREAIEREAMEETVISLNSKLNFEEMRMMSLFMDQPGALEKAINHIASIRGYKPEQVEAVLNAAGEFRDLNRQWWEEAEALGLLKKGQKLENYIAARDPLTKKSMRENRRLMARRNIDEMTEEEVVQFFPEFFQGTEKAPFMMSKVVRTVQERLALGMPTELNIGMSTLQRGYEQVQAVNGRRLMRTVFNDTQISRRIEDVSLLKDFNHLAEWRKKGYSLFDLDEMKTITTVDLNKMSAKDLVKKVNDPAGGIYQLPTTIVQDMTKAQKVLTNQSQWKGMDTKNTWVCGRDMPF